jgi:uncharacterized membrane-anchored protein YitT (DUF2179 family)
MPYKQSRLPILLRILLLVFASILLAFTINIFVRSTELFPGGFTGLTLLIQEIFIRYLGISLPYSLIIILLNVIPACICFFSIGKRFTILSCLMLVLSSCLVDFIPTFHLTNDMLLAAVFGGFLMALSITICLYAGASSGGTEFIAILISEKSGADAWNYILALNVVILISAGILFGWDKALYSIIFQFTSSQTLSFLYRKYQQVTFFIITDKPEEIYQCIQSLSGHDATVFKGKGCYAGQEHSMIYSVVSAPEARIIMHAVRKIDSNAFINVVKTKYLSGRFYRQPND